MGSAMQTSVSRRVAPRRRRSPPHLEDAYLAPVSVLSDGDLNAVKDQFFEGLLSPVKLLEKLQNLLGKNW